MNRIMRSVGLAVLMGYGGMCAGVALQKVFHNETNSSDKGPYVELGSVVLYVDAYPKVDQISLVPGMKGERRTFLLRDVQALTPECRDKINALNKTSGNLYAVRIANVTKPAKGMVVEVTYDPTRVEVKQENYQAITMQKSVVFHFYNKQFLNRLAKNTKPIIAVASRSQPKTVVIDCGHGGTDAGTIGCNKMAEKDVSLRVGLEVAQLLKSDGFAVALSRASDTTVALDERTTFANKNRADAFISIHANASPHKDACGIETHCMKPDLFSEHFCSLSQRDAQCCNALFSDRCQKGSVLAHAVHSELLLTLRNEQHAVVDRHVRYSVPQVLLGAQMPAVLVEIGFLSHPREAQLLADAAYQKKIARGIKSGVALFFQNAEDVL